MSESTRPHTATVLLFYLYVELDAPEKILDWQRDLCERLGLIGKIRIAREGLNGTVAGQKDACISYMNATRENELFSPIEFRVSEGYGKVFDGLSVRFVDEIVPINLPYGVAPYQNTAAHLLPHEVHQMIEEGNIIILDVRNYYESRIGMFEGAIRPNIRKFSQFPTYLNETKEMFRGKNVLMYCTGGIRCERASSYLLSLDRVYQVGGGIHNYVEAYPTGYFKGKNYVFDNRIAIGGNSVVSHCNYCENLWDEYQFCIHPTCRVVVLCCPKCTEKGVSAYCCTVCREQPSSGRRKPCDCNTKRYEYDDVEEYCRDIRSELLSETTQYGIKD